MSWTHGYSHRYPSNWSRLDIFNLSIQKICFLESFTFPVFYLDDVLNNISFHVNEQDNQTCFPSWVRTPTYAQTIYSAGLALKQGWVSITLFLGRIHIDMPEMVSSQLVNYHQSRAQTVPQLSPQASKSRKHLHIVSRSEAQQKHLAGSSQDNSFKLLQILYASSSLCLYMMQILNTNSSTLILKLNKYVILAINS